MSPLRAASDARPSRVSQPRRGEVERREEALRRPLWRQDGFGHAMTAPRRRGPSTVVSVAPGVQVDTSLDAVTDPVELAKLTLQAICRNVASPAAARAQAARTLLELAGALRPGGETSRRIASEMSLEELDDRLRALAPDTPQTP
jgi:hypothetical protein